MSLFDQLFQVMIQYYVRESRICWKWQAGDSKMVPTPLAVLKPGKIPPIGANRAPKSMSEWM